MSAPKVILVVDDDKNFIEIFSTKLTAAGFRVEKAKDGDEGIQKARKLKPDLVLMDVQMPNMNGVDAFLKIRDDPKCENVRVLFLTVLGDPRAEIQEINRRLSKEMGAVGYLKKTDDLDYLVNYIKNILK